ncbi:MAG: hypothetical protein KKB51_20495 [Candidatus Riflebacteria bacterium]|nr:hypothetical protein [Candidatus Riflebacteria bacterium]
MFAKFCCALILVFVLILPEAFACSLPAEPCAAIVPIDAAGNGMTLVTEGNKFFYIVPQGTTSSFKIVWDPAAHNTGNALASSKYEWCTKAGIGREPGTDSPNGYGYFPIQSMADFFSVRGNSGSVQEAFARETGLSTGDTFIPSITGPYSILSGFVKPGNQGRVTTLGNQSNEYPAPGNADIVGMSNTTITSAIDGNFPNVSWMTTKIPITTLRPIPLGGEIFAYRVAPNKAVVIRGEGLLIEGMEMELTTIRPSDYKAFIRTGNEAAGIELESNPQIVWSGDGVNGTPGPDFSVTFDTPSFSGNTDQSKIRLKVWSPGAGFEVSNLFWAWKEKVYTKESDRVTLVAAVRDASGTIITPAVTEMREIWKTNDIDYLCSEEIMIKLVKSAAEAGSTDFIVYDTLSPIASDFKITGADKNFKPTGPTQFDFTLKVLDTNPYLDKTFNTNIGGVSLVQNKANLDLQVYYSYPVYEYSAAGNLTMDQLKNSGYGLIDLESLSDKKPIFKSFKHETKWTWKKADVDQASLGIGTSEKLNGSTGRYAGSATTISGKFNVQQPRPWHECNDGGGKSEPEPVFKVFALSADSAGKKLTAHDEIKNEIGDSLLTDGAKPGVASNEIAHFPTDSNEIPPGDSRGQVTGGNIDDSRWSNIELLKVKDEIGPEIQVVVFDTRTNRYHVFGTKQNVAAGFSEFGGAGLKQDYSSGNVPYLGKESDISGAHQFNAIPNNDLLALKDLFDIYMVATEAVSTVNDDSQKGFVCQQNNRLVFYIRAVDNINSYLATKNSGISALTCNLTDKVPVEAKDWPTPANMLKPIEHVFRFENVDDNGAISPEYSLTVNARDYSGNTRDFKLNIAVLGRKLDIRTLEERRKRVN